MFRAGAMSWPVIVGDAENLTRSKGNSVAVLMFQNEIACGSENDMAFAAPVVGEVAGAVDDTAELDVSKLPGLGGGSTRGAGMLGRGDLRPVRDAGLEIEKDHGTLQNANTRQLRMGGVRIDA